VTTASARHLSTVIGYLSHISSLRERLSLVLLGEKAIYWKSALLLATERRRTKTAELSVHAFCDQVPDTARAGRPAARNADGFELF
jgi:hypothetical protein